MFSYFSMLPIFNMKNKVSSCATTFSDAAHFLMNPSILVKIDKAFLNKLNNL